METKQILKNLDTVFRYVLVAILLLSFLIFIIVFTINWEAYFFGVKLNSAPAGMYLLLQGMIAGSLAFLLIKYLRYTLAVAVLAVIYFGYTFVDSAVTIQTLTDNLYSPLLLTVFIISLLFLIIHILSARFCKGDDRPTMNESTIHSICTKIMTQETEEDKIIIGALLVIVGFIAVIFILPLTIAIIVSLMELF